MNFIYMSVISNHFQYQCMGTVNHTLHLTHLRLEDRNFLGGRESELS